MLPSVLQSFGTAAVWTALLTTIAATTITTTTDCSYRFTDVHSTVLTSERDTQVSVDFGFETSSAECELPRNFTIFFGKKAGLFPNTECMLKHIDGVCIPSMKSEICKCLPNTRYRLSEAIKKDENTRYEFRTQPRYGETLVVNVTDLPKFQSDGAEIHVQSDEDADLQFNILMNRVSISGCQLYQKNGPGRGKVLRGNIDCSSSNLTGTPPDLTLTVRLDNVRKEEEGLWRLELTNDMGTAQLDFHLYVKAGEDTSESQSSQHGVDLTVVISVTVAALAATLITFRVVSIRKARKSRVSSDVHTDAQSSPPTEPPRQEESGGNEAGPNCETNYYWEIQDDTPPTSPDPPRVCLDPALSDNYLRPSISPEVKKGTDDARNVTPFYNNSVLRPVVQLHNTICKPDSDSPLPCRVTKSTSKDTASSSGYIEMSRPAEKRSSDNSQERREYVNI